MDVATDVSAFPKVYFRSSRESGSGPLQVKVEINTHETSPARPHVRLPHEVDSPWWSGRADVLTFEPAELVATKRRKGRDLFDLWLALTEMALASDDVLACFAPCRPDGYTTATAVANLQEHVGHGGFRGDVANLVVADSAFDVDIAAALVTDRLLSHLDPK